MKTVIPQYTPMAPTFVREPFHRDGWVYLLPWVRVLFRSNTSTDWDETTGRLVQAILRRALEMRRRRRKLSSGPAPRAGSCCKHR